MDLYEQRHDIYSEVKDIIFDEGHMCACSAGSLYKAIKYSKTIIFNSISLYHQVNLTCFSGRRHTA